MAIKNQDPGSLCTFACKENNKSWLDVVSDVIAVKRTHQAREDQERRSSSQIQQGFAVFFAGCYKFESPKRCWAATGLAAAVAAC
jgi:hypothetical protein